MRNKFLLSLAIVFAGLSASAQTASWKISSEALEDDIFRVSFAASIADSYHIYGPGDDVYPFAVEYSSGEAVSLISSNVAPADEDGRPAFSGSVVFTQEVRAQDGKIDGTITWQGCREQVCEFPEELPFSLDALPSGGEGSKAKGHLWALILEAILWGFAMLLTPCVFPMVPMTVSFFLKGEGNGRFKAFMYGLFIILLYTIPICIIIGLTWLLGGESVTADIFNWLATHWLPNIIFFLVFFIFALSFFGAFEITLPSSWTTSTDAKSGKRGLAGVFFMALTLVLVSFSCTGPIVGSVLIKSTQGEFWTPMITMLAFSIAFALPFTVLALFPSLMKKMKSGSWLGSVKIILGFVELALGLKFLSTADQTYHWHILDREVYLALWIVIFTLLGLYLIRVIRFKDEEPNQAVSILRLMLSIGVFSFVVYLIPGMWGAPLKGLSGYLPPMETQDFVLGNAPSAGLVPSDAPQKEEAQITVAQGLLAYTSLDEGLKAAKEAGKAVFVDITGYGCVNCREMESRVWSDPEVLARLRDRFVIVALHTDDKAKLPQADWFTTPGGKVLKTVGSVNSYIARTRFGVNSQPNYIILDTNGNIVAGPRAYDLSIPGYISFLDSAL